MLMMPFSLIDDIFTYAARRVIDIERQLLAARSMRRHKMMLLEEARRADMQRRERVCAAAQRAARAGGAMLYCSIRAAIFFSRAICALQRCDDERDTVDISVTEARMLFEVIILMR